MMLSDLSKRVSRYKLPLTAALVAAAALVRVGFLGELGPRIPYVTFFPAVMAAALLFGLGAGLTATLLSAAVAVAIQSVGGVVLPTWPDRLGLLMFLAGSVMSAWLAHALSKAHLAAAKAEAEARLARESREADKKLLASRRDLAKAQALTHLGNWTCDRATGAVEWSDELYNICGVARDSFAPTPEAIANLFHPEDLPVHQQWLERIAAGMEAQPFDCRIVRPGGEIRHVRIFGESETDQSPAPATRVFGTVLDVTDTWRALNALEASQERFGSLFESAPIGIFRADPEGRILEANPAMARMFGYRSPAELMEGVTDMRSLLFRDPDLAAQRMASVLEGDGWVGWEDKLRHADGARITASLRLRALPGLDGSPACLEGMVEDITESRDMLDALIESEGRFRAIFDRCPLAILVADPETSRFAMANQSAAGLLGYGHQELLGMSVYDIHPPEALPMVLAHFEASASGAAGLSPPLPVLRKDGGVRYAMVSGAHVEIGGRVLLMGFFTDLTAQIQAERELGASESKYRDLYQGMLDGYAKVDMEGRILECNAAFRDMLGYGDQEIISLTYHDITPARWHPMEMEILTGQVLERGYSDVYEKEYVRADGTVFPVELRTYLLRDDSGRPSGMWAIVRDVTPRKLAEEETARAMAALKEATRAKSDFLANMSHEIRTPLSAIMGLTDLCLRMADPAKTAANLSMIRDSARLLSSIVGDVLDISRIEAGRLVLEDAPFEPRALVYAVLDSERLTLGGKNIALSADIAADVPETLSGDEVRLGQVLGNLVGNAVKFTREGSVEVRAEVSGRPAPGRVELLFTVRDTGIGIPPAQQAIVFDSFRQADLSYAKYHQGVGLGLAICRELTGLMGGRIWVESEPGKGSAFFFTTVLGLAPAHAAPQARITLPEVARQDIRPASILVAEDNPYNRHVFTEFLASLGHAVQAAEDGREALARLAGERFDLVLMDVQMPGLDGLEAVRRLRAGECGPEAARLPVVALTAYAMAGDRERFLEAGMTDYLSKPVNLDLLAQAVARHTGRSGRSQASSPGENPMAPLMAEAMGYVRQRLDEASSALAVSDTRTAAMAGHDVKGTAMGLALEPLVEPATLFEKACRTGDAAMAGRLLGSLRVVLEGLERAYADSSGSGS